LDDFAGLVARYGVIAVFLFTFLENTGLPIPAFPVLMLAGAYASTRHATLLMVLVAAVAGALLADGIWYFVGRWRGKRVLDHLCRVSFNPDACLERAVDGFHRRKSATILFAKFLPGVNTIMPPLAGVAAMPFFLFLLLDFAGSLLWAGAAVALGFAFGERVAETARGVQGMMGQLLMAGIAVTIAWRAGYRFWLVKRYGGNRVDRTRCTGGCVKGRISSSSTFGATTTSPPRTDDSRGGAVAAGVVSPARHAPPAGPRLVFYCT